MQSWFLRKEYHRFKGSLFLIFGISAGLPIFQLLFFPNSVVGLNQHIDFFNWYFGGILYIVGALFYIAKFPEKFWPGRFCIVGNSHQIFHFFVLGGVLLHYLGSVELYLYRLDNQCPA